MHFDRRPADVDQVAVGELDTLRDAGRPGRVDDCAEIVGGELFQPGGDLGQLPRRILHPACNFRVHQCDLAEGSFDFQLGRQRRAGSDRECRGAVHGDRLRHLGRAVGIDRDRDRADRLDRPVTADPLHAVLGDEDHRVARSDPGVDQAGGHRQHVALSIVPGVNLPLVAALKMNQGAVAVASSLPEEDTHRRSVSDCFGVDARCTRRGGD